MAGVYSMYFLIFLCWSIKPWSISTKYYHHRADNISGQKQTGLPGDIQRIWGLSERKEVAFHALLLHIRGVLYLHTCGTCYQSQKEDDLYSRHSPFGCKWVSVTISETRSVNSKQINLRFSRFYRTCFSTLFTSGFIVARFKLHMKI
jgi:hypothetical protein